MSETTASGLPGNWLNGWLAAIGVTVLLPDVRLAWTADPVPVARFIHAHGDLGREVAQAVPDADRLARLAIARHHPQRAEELPRRVTVEVFAARAVIARQSQDDSLSSTVTDLALEESGSCGHGPFDPPVPRGITLHERLMAVRAALDDLPADAFALSFAGRARRVKGNGLGFDVRRMPSGVQAGATVSMDPCVELLCFFGLRVFPVRGSGVRVAQRGWDAPVLRRFALQWPVWSPALDFWAIDALLDRAWRVRGRHAASRIEHGVPSNVEWRELTRWGIQGLFGTVAQQPKSSSDVTRAYGAQRIR